MQEKSAGLVLVKDGEYLLLHYAAGHWDFPKGHIENGESIEQAALRELKEETAIEDVAILPGFQESINYFFKREGETIAKEAVFLLARTTNGSVTLSHEHQGFEWLTYEKAIQKLTYDNAKEILRKASEWLNNEKS